MSDGPDSGASKVVGAEPVLERTAAVRVRRKTGWWEPTFNPALVNKMIAGTWSFDNDRGPRHKIFFGDSFQAAIKSGLRRVITGVTFTECDFQGFFEADSQIVFTKCNFINCDLAMTTWTNTKFSQCVFSCSSFGITVFNNCDFKDCIWDRLGFSPNETVLSNTLVSNASAMISSGYTNLDPEVLKEHNVTRTTQVCRLEVTKATLARQILKSFEKSGDERSYYGAVRTFELQQAKGRAFEALRQVHERQRFRLIALIDLVLAMFWFIEMGALFTIGLLSGWGSSIVRPIAILTCTTLVFGLLYGLLPGLIEHATYKRALEIGLLAGFTNYHAESSFWVTVTQEMQLTLSCFLYAISFASLISRFSRVR